MKRCAFLILLFLPLVLQADDTAQSTAPDYPRVVEADGRTLMIHHPLIDRWVNYKALEGWIPLEVTDAAGKTWIGSVRARARTTVDLSQRMVTLSDKEVVAIRFSDDQVPEAISDWVASAVLGSEQRVLLDEVLLSLAEDFEPPVPVTDNRGFNRRPPRIVVSEQPQTLLLIDQEPVQAPIEGTSLDVVLNTDRDLFYDREQRLWYLINEGTWQSNSLLASGEWNSTDRLPPAFASLSAGDRWSNLREALPAQLPQTAPPPVLVSLEATELIIMAGEPRLQGIEGADGLEVVSNTERDLFRFDGNWYFLTAGRWFRTPAFDDSWVLAEEIPPVFQQIPPEHDRAHVRRSIPGTLESALAYIEATLPQEKVVSARDIPSREVTYAGQPRFEPINGTQVEKAVNTPFAVIRHNNFYYLNYEAAWYSASEPTGPWRVTTLVPEEIYDIPPSDPLYPITFVRPMGKQGAAEVARFEYTEAYNGRYTIGRRAVQGTGWSYQPWISYPMAGPVYWGYPHTYGWGHRYRSPRGWAAYPPAQSITFDGPTRGLGGTPADVAEQDPGVTRRGYDYTTLAQQRGAGDTVSPYLADDLFANPQGDVYRRSNDGWSRHEDGEWSTMSELERQYGVSSPRTAVPEGQQRQAYKQDEDDIERMERYFERRAKSYNMHSAIYVGR